MICPKCGTENPNGNLLCLGCGAVLDTVQVQKNINPGAQATPFAAVVTQDITAPIENPINTITRSMAKKNNKRKFFKVLFVLFIIGIIGYFISRIYMDYKLDFKGIGDTSFFIEDKTGMYAVFDRKGKQLTKFVYKDVNPFSYGFAYAKKEDGSTSIIDLDGLETFNSKEYISFRQFGSLFIVRDENYDFHLIKPDGSIVTNDKVDSYENINNVITITKDKVIDIIDRNGKTVYSIDKVNDEELKISKYTDNYISVLYNNINYYISVLDSKLLYKENSTTINNISSFDKDNNVLLLSNSNKYRIISNNTSIELASTCKNMTVEDYFYRCTPVDGVEYLYNELGENIGSKDTRIGYESKDVYALSNNFKTLFYKNGKEVSTVEGISLVEGLTKSGLYLVVDKSNNYDYYNLDGKRVTDKGFSKADIFKNNKYAPVCEKEGTCYLIDNKGSKVTDNYKDAVNYSSDLEDVYVVTTSEGKRIINGKKKSLGFEYYSDIIIEDTSRGFVLFCYKQGKLSVIDYDKNLLLLKTSAYPEDIVTRYNYFINKRSANDEYFSYYSRNSFYEL